MQFTTCSPKYTQWYLLVTVEFWRHYVFLFNTEALTLDAKYPFLIVRYRITQPLKISMASWILETEVDSDSEMVLTDEALSIFIDLF